MLNVDSDLFTSSGHNDICPALDPELDPVDRYQQSRQGVERRSSGPPYGVPIQSRYHEDVRVIACELIRLSTCAFRGWPTWARRARSAVRSCCRGTKRYVSMRYPSSLIALNPQLVFILADRGRRRRLHRPCHDRSTHRLKDVSANAASLSVVLWYTKCILPNSHHIES